MAAQQALPALHAAWLADDIDAIHAAIARGAHVNEAASRSQATPLHYVQSAQV